MTSYFDEDDFALAQSEEAHQRVFNSLKISINVYDADALFVKLGASRLSKDHKKLINELVLFYDFMIRVVPNILPNKLAVLLVSDIKTAQKKWQAYMNNCSKCILL